MIDLPQRARRDHVARHPRVVRTSLRLPDATPGWRGPDPFDVVSSVTVTTPARRGGLALLLGAVGLLVLVAASGSTLQMLLRMEGS